MLVKGGGGGVDLCSIYDKLPPEWRRIVGEVATAEVVKKLLKEGRYREALQYAFYAPKGFTDLVLAEWLRSIADRLTKWIKSGAKGSPPVSEADIEELRSHALEAGATKIAEIAEDLEKTLRDVEAYKWLQGEIEKARETLEAAEKSVDALVDALNDKRFDDAARVLLNMSMLFKKASDEIRKLAEEARKRFGHREIADKVYSELVREADSLEYASEALSHAASEVAAVGQLLRLVDRLSDEPSLLYDDEWGRNVAETYRVLAREYRWLMSYTGPGADLVQEIASFAKNIMDHVASFIANYNPDLYRDIAAAYEAAGIPAPVSLSSVEAAEAEIRSKLYPVMYRLEEVLGKITGFLKELAEATERTWSKSGWVKLFSLLAPFVWAGYYLASIPGAILSLAQARLEQLMDLARGDYRSAVETEKKILEGLVPHFTSIAQGLGFILSMVALASLASSAASAAESEVGDILSSLRGLASRLSGLLRVFDVLLPELPAVLKPLERLLPRMEERLEPEAVLARLGEALREEGIAVSGRGADVKMVIDELARSLGVEEDEAAAALLQAIRDAARMRTETDIAVDLARLRDIAERLESLESQIRSGEIEGITVVTEAERLLDKLVRDLEKLREEAPPSLREAIDRFIEKASELRSRASEVAEEFKLHDIVAVADKSIEEMIRIENVCPECIEMISRGDIAGALARLAEKEGVREAVEIGHELAKLYDELAAELAKIAPGVPVPKLRVETEIPKALEEYAARLFLERHPELYDMFPDAAQALDRGDLAGFAKAIENYVNTHPEKLPEAIKVVDELVRTMRSVIDEVKGSLTEGEVTALERAERTLIELENSLKKVIEERISPTIVETVKDLERFLERTGHGDVASLLQKFLETGNTKFIDEALRRLGSAGDRSAEALLAYELYRAGLLEPDKYGFIVGRIGVYDLERAGSPPPEWLRELMNGGTVEEVLRVGGKEYRIVREVDIAPGKTTIRYRVETPEGWWAEYIYTITSDGEHAATAEMLRYDPEAPPSAVAELETVLREIADRDSSLLRNLVVIVNHVPVAIRGFGEALRAVAAALASNEEELWRKLLSTGTVVRLPTSIAGPGGLGVRIDGIVFVPVEPGGQWSTYGRFKIGNTTLDLPYLGTYNGLKVFGIPTVNLGSIYAELREKEKEETKTETGQGEKTGEKEKEKEKTKESQETSTEAGAGGVGGVKLPFILPPFIQFLGMVGLAAAKSAEEREVLVL